MLAVNNLIKKYNSKVVLNKVSFEVLPGSVFGLLGSNGAGKTTALRIISGILIPEEGNVTYCRESICGKHYNKIGYLPEERGLHKKSKVKDILFHFAKLKGLDNSEIEKGINEWSEKLKISDLLNMKSEQLSKGNQQKVQIISALLHNPEIIILDEPFSGFDPVNQSTMQNLVHELAATNKTIILSTHLMNYADALCDSVCMLNKGDVVLKGNLESIRNDFSESIIKVKFSNENSINTGRYEVHSKNRNELKIRLTKDDLIPEVVRDLSSKNEIISIEKIQTTLHEIYINKLGTESVE